MNPADDRPLSARCTFRHQVGGYRAYAPPRRLWPWVEAFWIHTTPIDTERRPAGHRVVADPSFNLAFTCHRGGGGVSPRLLAMGPVRNQRPFDIEPGFEMACVRIKLEWVESLLGISPSDHADALDDFVEVRPHLAVPLLAELRQTGSAHEALDVLEGAVSTWVRRSGDRVPHWAVLEGMGILRRTGGRVPVERLARHLDLSSRSVRRLFYDAVRQSPKVFGRLLRFQNVLLASDCEAQPDWSTTALDGGYFDQAHMIRDFQFFGGMSPARLHAERRRESELSNPA